MKNKEVSFVNLEDSFVKNIRFFSYNLAIVTGKCIKQKTEQKTVCNSTEVEDEFHFLFQYSNYDKPRKEFTEIITY